MDTTAADDKIQAVVRLVLQAVDQRLEIVREQLVQVTHTIASNHADLNRRIDECHQMVASVQSGAVSTVDADPAASQASARTAAAVDLLTDQVSVLQARLSELTTARVADVAAAIAAPAAPIFTPAAVAHAVAAPVAAVPAVAAVSAPTPMPTPNPVFMPAATPNLAPTRASAPSLAPAPSPKPAASPATDLAPPSSPILAPTASNATPPTPAAATMPVRPTVRVAQTLPRVKAAPPAVRLPSSGDASAATSAAPARPTPESTEHGVDFASLNAQISARLAAAVDRALGELSASGTPGMPSNTP